MANRAIVNPDTASHYRWGKASEAWSYLERDDLTIIVEEVPPGESDSRHYHRSARQYFYVLSGFASIELQDTILKLIPGDGIEIEPGAVHRVFNESLNPVRFIVISMPDSHNDRIQV